jgi:hypothetical protein
MFKQHIIIFLLLCFISITNSQADLTDNQGYNISLGSTRDGGGIVVFIDSSNSHGLEAKRVDETGVFTWDAAVAAASAYGASWHLPTKDELNLLYQQKNVVGGFAGFYWSSTDLANHHAVAQYFGVFGVTVGLPSDYALKVRAVRAF